jgi:hypothetical protein
VSELARRMMGLFEGSIDAHGTYDPSSTTVSAAGKIEIKTSARTMREPVTEEMWDEHLRGVRPLGIIPLRPDDTIVWGCGDIDQYDINLGDLVSRVEAARLPVVVTRSKSGGAHLYLFLSEPAAPAAVMAWFRHNLAKLGHGDSEVFPKQTSIRRENGDLGNWIIAPYFGDEQPGVRVGGGEMTAEEFVRKAEATRVNLSDLEVVRQGRVNGHKHEPATPLADGPPCLEHLVQAGFPEGTRNKGLFALGVYCKKRWPDDWQAKLEEFNQSTMRPPLTSDEVQTTVRSLEKKDYSYTCKDVPLV